MKKIYLSLLAAAAMTSAMQAQQAPTALWGNLLKGEKNNIGLAVGRAADGNLFYLNSIGSTETSQETLLNDQVVATGSVYSGTSYNNGVSLIKTDAKGNLLMNAWTVAGEVASNQGGVIPTSDGGATVVVKMRHSQNYGTTPINFLNAAQESFSFDWTLDAPETARYYKVLVLHFSAQGLVEWSRVINVDNSPQPNATTAANQAQTSDGMDVNSVVSDSEGNIFLGGRLRKEATFALADGTTQVLSPRNTANWDGDTQKSVGDLYIVKLDPQGYYLSHIMMEGDVATNEVISSMTIDKQGYLYVQGTVQGTSETSNISFGGNEMQAGAIAGLFAARLGTDLSVDWARIIASDYSGSVFQKTQINMNDGVMWITGKMRANLVDGDNTLAGSSLTRDGFLLGLDANNGTWLAATVNGKNQSGLYGVLDSNEDQENIYVFGNTLSAPTFLQKRSKATLEVVEQWDLQTASDDINPIMISQDTLFTTARISRDNTLLGNDELTFTATTQARAVLMAAFKLPVQLVTAVDDVLAPKAQVEVKALTGALQVTASQPTQVSVYNLTGAVVATVAAGPAATTVSLPAGLYIAAGQKLIVR